MKTILMLVACTVMAVACKNQDPKSQDNGTPGITYTGDTVILPAGSVLAEKIGLITVVAEPVEIPCATSGIVRAIPECIADVAVPFEGRIVESFVKAGQTVKAGTPLFSLHSPEYAETIKAYQQAQREKQIAERNLLRQQDLVKQGVGIQKELDEALLNFDIASGQLDNLRTTLSIYSVDIEKTDVGKPMVVTAPIRGEVVRNAIRVGQYLKSDSEPMVCIAELSVVQVIAQVKENRIGFISDFDETEVTLGTYPGKVFPGRVTYIGKILDEQTRSLEVILACDNPGQLLKPGMFATVTFIHREAEGISIPATALVQGTEHSFVYREAGQNRFVKTPVTVTSAQNGKVVVSEGIRPGDRIIGSGALFIN